MGGLTKEKKVSLKQRVAELEHQVAVLTFERSTMNMMWQELLGDSYKPFRANLDIQVETYSRIRKEIDGYEQSHSQNRA